MRTDPVHEAARELLDALEVRQGGYYVPSKAVRKFDAALATEPVLEDEIPSMATGEAFSAVYKAILDPEHYCKQLTSFPKPLRQMEPVAHWQTRAVLAALSKLGTEPIDE